MKKIVPLGCCICGALMLMMSAAADVIMLKNGDRISGIVRSVADGKVSVVTEYAGEIRLPVEAISTIETDAPRALALPDDRVLEGALVGKEGKPGILSEEEWLPVPLDSVTALADDADALAEMLTPPPKKRWSGSVDAGLSLRSGNTDTTDAKFDAKVKRTGEDNTLSLGFSAAYGAAEGTLNTRRYATDFRWQYYLRDRLYLYTLGLAERDDGRKLDLRLQGGGGVGYDMVKRDKTTLATDMGLTYTYERWAPFTPWERDALREGARLDAYNRLYSRLSNIDENWRNDRQGTIQGLRQMVADIRNPLGDQKTRSENYLNLRIGVNFTQQLFKASVLSEEMVFMPNLENMGEFRVLSELALTTPVTDALSLRTSLKTEYDSLAGGRNVESWDHTLMTQIRYTF